MTAHCLGDRLLASPAMWSCTSKRWKKEISYFTYGVDKTRTHSSDMKYTETLWHLKFGQLSQFFCSWQDLCSLKKTVQMGWVLFLCHLSCQSQFSSKWRQMKQWTYEGVIALWQDNSLFQAAHYNPPQLFEHTLQYSLLTHSGKQGQSAKTCTHT